jgi:hypothetical protein
MCLRDLTGDMHFAQGHTFTGGCTLPDEAQCEDSSCPSGTACDPNGVCRNACPDGSCLLTEETCMLGVCYDRNAQPYKRIGPEGGTFVSPSTDVEITLPAGVATEDLICRVTDPMEGVRWEPDGVRTDLVLADCWRASDDKLVSGLGPATVTMSYRAIEGSWPEPFTLRELGIHVVDTGCFLDDADVDEVKGTLRQNVDTLMRFELVLSDHGRLRLGDDVVSSRQEAISEPGPAGIIQFSTSSTTGDCYPNRVGLQIMPEDGTLPLGTYDLEDPASWELLSVHGRVHVVAEPSIIYGRVQTAGTIEGAAGTVEIIEGARGGRIAILTDVVLPRDPASESQSPFDGPIIVESAFLSEGAAHQE